MLCPKNNEQGGFLLIEALVVLMISGVLMAITFPNILNIARRATTKHEMRLLATVVQLYEAENGAVPTTLAALTPVYYTAGSGYNKDAWGTSYQYNVGPRTVCSTNFTPTFCVAF